MPDGTFVRLGRLISSEGKKSVRGEVMSAHVAPRRQASLDGAANLDQLRRMTSTVMSALLLGTVTPKEGNAKLGRIDKRMNALEREIGRGVNSAA